MIGESQPISLTVVADGGQVGSAQAVSMGLIVTELVINALKYAFPDDKAGSQVTITYARGAEHWRLSVSDNGVGKAAAGVPGTPGLGTVIVQALAKQLGAQVEILSAPTGLSVAINHHDYPEEGA